MSIKPSHRPGSMAHEGRIHSLDFVRGVAALAIVVWHWQHMAYLPHADPEALTNYGTIRLAFLSRGWVAVDVFFTISGIIFFTYYSGAISGGRISFAKFAWLRFSRLYPLFLATTILVVALQFIFVYRNGASFVYPAPSTKSIIINILFLQGWGFSPDTYINGPTWSVSVELLVYVLFFVYCRLVPLHGYASLAAAVVLGLAFSTVDVFIGRGIAEFFMGGLIARSFRGNDDRLGDAWLLMLCAALVWLGWAVTLFELATGLFHAMLASIHVHGAHLSPKAIDVLLSLPVRLILIPMTLWSMVLHEKRGTRFYDRLSAVGDITYSSYLIHFPLSLVIAILVSAGAIGAVSVLGWLSMALYFIALVVLSALVFSYVEMPAQRYLRSLMPTSPRNRISEQKRAAS